ncbi:MAG: hypothetical protein U9Q33_04355 [Campylobacterota bacterium]|nr:hypothetical protein [Campylobacterota bacterium]
MNKITLTTILLASTLLGEVSLNKPLPKFELLDQFDSVHFNENSTKKLIFAFSKDIGHNVNEFLEKQKKSFLEDNDAKFIIDLSAAPSFVRSLFIVPKLEKYKYPVLIIDEEEVSKQFINFKHQEKVMLVTLDKQKVKNIEFLTDVNELKKAIER